MRFQIQFNLGCGTTTASQVIIAGLTKTKVKASLLKTKSGSFIIDHVCEVTFKLPGANLPEVVAEAKNLSLKQQQQELEVLQKFEVVFDGTLGDWQCKFVDIELKDPHCKPVHAKPYPVP